MAQGVTQLPTAGQAPVPPQNLEAEESVLGAIMLLDGGALTWDVLLDTGLTGRHFYRESHRRIWEAALALRDRHEPVDAITVADELEARGHLDDVGGKARVGELAALVPATSNSPHYARLIIEAAQTRDLIRVGAEIQRFGYDRTADPNQLIGQARDLVEELERGAYTADLEPLWWHDALHEPIPDTAEYVDGVLQAGVLADIVGLPYLHKTALALELAAKIAAGEGLLLGHYRIRQQANVAYFWGDDSRPQELRRIQDYAAACEASVLPLGFYLNPNLTLPDGIPALKAQIRRHEFRVVVFDSLYNFAPGIDWVKDTQQVASLYHQLKRLCDDIEGLTIVLVDHASKPSDSNRGRDASVSSYGSVWKAAAVRCSIVITKDGSGLYAQAVGNNVKGFPKTPIRFDDDALELRLIEVKEHDPEAAERLEELVLQWVVANPGKSTNQIVKNVKGRGEDVRSAVRRLADNNLILDTYGTSSQLPGTNPDELSQTTPTTHPETSSQKPGTKKTKTAWIPLNHAAQPRPSQNGTTPDELRPGTGSVSHGNLVPDSSSPVGGRDQDEPAGEPDTTQTTTTIDPDDFQ